MASLHMNGSVSPSSPDTDQTSLSYSPGSTINSSGIADPSSSSNPSTVNSELRLGKMHLVDLAGSERVTLSGAEGDTLIETQNINLSLTAIGEITAADVIFIEVYCTVLYCTVLYSTVLYCTVLYCPVLWKTVRGSSTYCYLACGKSCIDSPAV